MQKEADQEKTLDQDTWSGKMSLEPLAQTKEKTSVRSSKKRSASSAKKPPLFLCLSADGQQPDASMEWGGIGALHGVYSMHSFGECPSAAVESHLSQILEDSPRQKYYLSEKACQGILRRAERRGKELPPVLKKALLEMIKFWQTQGGGAVTLKIRSGCEGGGKGALMQYEKSATLSTHPDQTLFQPIAENDACLTPWDVQSRRIINENGKWPALYGGEGGGHGYVMQSTPEPTYCIQGNCIDRADTAGCNGKGWTEDVSYTLNTIDRPAVVQTAGFKYLQGAKAKGIAYEDGKAPTLSANQPDASVVVALENHPNDSRVKISEDNVVQTLCSRMGTGGGNTPMILKVKGGEIYSMTVGSYMTVSEDQTATLMARDYKDPQCVTYQQVTGSLMANSHPGSYTGQDANNDMLVAGVSDQQYIVRRLTPLECERLQGFPDGWTDIGPWDDEKGKHHKESTDSARYKALGNSIALPPWRYVLQKLSLCCYSDHTMGSLFDGIGGFPLIWESLNGAGSCLWASEIESFPIAVTSEHFSGEKL